MNNTANLQGLSIDLLSVGIGAVIGLALAFAVCFAKIVRLEREKAALNARLDGEKAGLGDHFSRLAQEALSANAQNFLTLAQERLKAAHADGAHTLDKKSLEIQKMVEPVQQQLLRMNSMVEELKSTDKTIREDLQNLHKETSKLTGVLRNPSAQGKWGEFILETILEKAHLIKGVHYDTQGQIEGGRRPDVIINLHDGFKIAIDSKAPINGHIARLDDDMSEGDITEVQNDMARAVRKHVKDLGAKTYQDNVGGSDFVILFLPSEAVFSATLRSDPDIVDFAAQNKVVIASPTLIMSLLRVVGLSWRQVEMAKNAADISALGEELSKRLAKFLDHFAKVGRSMESARSSYDQAVGSLNRMVLPAARKFKKMHITGPANIDDLPVLDKANEDNKLIEDANYDDTDDDKVSHG